MRRGRLAQLRYVLWLGLLLLPAGRLARASFEGRLIVMERPDAAPRRLRVGPHLDEGRVSIAHEALDLDTGERFAVKIQRHREREQCAHDRGSYDKELALLRRASGPTLVSAEGIGVLEDEPERRALVMPLYRGRQLHHHPQAFPRRNAVLIGMQILRAVRSLERAGLQHTDIHTKQVLVDSEDPASVRLLDLGNAREASAPLPTPGNHDLVRTAGLVAVMLGGEGDGGVLGRIPEVRVDRKTLRDVVARGLSRDPREQYPNAQAFIDALRPFSR